MRGAVPGRAVILMLLGVAGLGACRVRERVAAVDGVPPPASRPAAALDAGAPKRASPAPGSAPASQPREVPACRAVLDLRLKTGATKSGERERPGYVAADLRVGAVATVAARPGLVARAGDTLYGLDIVTRTSGGATWDEVHATPLPGGKRRLVLAVGPDEVEPNEPDQGQANYEESRASVTSVVGPYLSVYVGNDGYHGGVHGTDSSHYTTVKVPEGTPVEWLKVLGSGVLGELNRGIKSADRERREEQGAGVSPLPRLGRDDLSLGAALGLRHHTEVGLSLRLMVPCCSWAENHNRYDLEVTLDKVPRMLQPHVRWSEDHAGFLEAPDGCAAVRVWGGVIEVWRPGAAKPQVVAWSGPPLEELVGVVWLGRAVAFDLADLPSPGVSEKVRGLVTRARGLARSKRTAEAIAVLREAAALEPQNPSVLSDLGWLLLLVGQLGEARSVSERALTAADTDRQRAAILYNLGRVAEAKGDPATARARYQESLRRRPSKVVEKQLARLPQ